MRIFFQVLETAIWGELTPIFKSLAQLWQKFTTGSIFYRRYAFNVHG